MGRGEEDRVKENEILIMCAATTAAWRSVKPARKVADLWSAAEKLQLLGKVLLTF